MAAISSNGTGGGLASATTTWAGGVVPTAVDDVTIVAGDTITRDSMAIYGSLSVFGTDKASRLISSGIACAGAITYQNGGICDLGTDIDPLPTGITTRTDCICASNGQFRIIVNPLAEIYTNGVDVRLQHTTLTADTALNGASITVAAATGWQVGDRLAFEDDSSAGPKATLFSPTITSIAGFVIGLSAPAPRLLNGTTTQIYVANLEMPIWFGSSGVAPTQLYIDRTNIAALGVLAPATTVLRTATIENAGYNGWVRYGGLTFNTNDYRILPNIVSSDVTLVNTYEGFSLVSCRATLSNYSCVNTIQSGLYGQSCFWGYGTCAANLSGFFALNSRRLTRSTLPVGTISNSIALNMMSITYKSKGYNTVFNGGLWRGMSQWLFNGPYDGKGIDIIGVDIQGAPWLKYAGGYGSVNLLNCNLIDQHGAPYWVSDVLELNVKQSNANGNPKYQSVHLNGGSIYRDYTHVISSSTPVASIQFEPRSATIPVEYKAQAVIQVGTTLTASVLVERDANYNGSVLPVLEIVGEGTATSTVATATTETLSVTTPVAVATHTASIILRVLGTSGYAWFDDLTIAGQVHDIGQNLFAGGTEISNVIDITDTAKSVNLTGLITGSDVVILDAGTNTVLGSVDQNSGTTWLYSSPVPQTIDIGIIKPGYVTQYIYGYSLNQKGAALPIIQLNDRSYT